MRTTSTPIFLGACGTCLLIVLAAVAQEALEFPGFPQSVWHGGS